MKIKIDELLEQIRCALADEFVAVVGKEDEEIKLCFDNGQKFVVSVKEI